MTNDVLCKKTKELRAFWEENSMPRRQGVATKADVYYESGGCSAQREYNSCSPVSATGDHKKNCRFRTFVSETGDYSGTVQSNREGRGLSFLKVATKSNVLVRCVNITILLQPVRRVTTTRCDDSSAVSVMGDKQCAM
ncbi:hypothetical protein VTP01DRAFT_3786 [Rhizomucor pusillus]|uniref:uncharacterized protein n=1 Tax=Rhizomucor pusillus TaxID=4840 RepID=UPI0037431E99